MTIDQLKERNAELLALLLNLHDHLSGHLSIHHKYSSSLVLMLKKCAENASCTVCDDTGSLSKTAYGALDCTHCDMAARRAK